MKGKYPNKGGPISQAKLGKDLPAVLDLLALLYIQVYFAGPSLMSQVAK